MKCQGYNAFEGETRVFVTGGWGGGREGCTRLKSYLSSVANVTLVVFCRHGERESWREISSFRYLCYYYYSCSAVFLPGLWSVLARHEGRQADRPSFVTSIDLRKSKHG